MSMSAQFFDRIVEVDRALNGGDMTPERAARLEDTRRKILMVAGEETVSVVQEVIRKMYDEYIQIFDKNLEKARRTLDVLFPILESRNEPQREAFLKKLRHTVRQYDLKFEHSPASMIRTMAKRGKEALTLLGKPPADLGKFASLSDRILPDLPEGPIDPIDEAARCNLHLAARWAQHGCNVFQVSADLAAGMILTEASNNAELHLPFDAFVLSLSSRAVPFFVADAENGSVNQWADTIWLYTFEDEGVTHVQIAVVWHGLALVERLPQTVFTTDKAATDEEEIAPEDRVCLDAAWRLVRNFIAWLDAIGGMSTQRREQIPKKLAEKRARGGEVWPTQWQVGREVKLGAELHRAAAEAALGRSKRHNVSGWRVRARFIVRGHWRNQACGEGRKEHRRKWIEPFWKGPAGEAAWSHLYTDKTQEL